MRDINNTQASKVRLKFVFPQSLFAPAVFHPPAIVKFRGNVTLSVYYLRLGVLPLSLKSIGRASCGVCVPCVRADMFQMTHTSERTNQPYVCTLASTSACWSRNSKDLFLEND